MSDVDEIPSRHTINLLRRCRTSVPRYQSGKTTYAHYRQSHRTCMCTNFTASTDHAMEKLEGVSVSQSPTQELIFTLEIATENEKFPSRLEDAQNPKGLNIDAEVQADHLLTIVQSMNRKLA